MPSKPVLKAVSANDFPDTDPMAELSRIMGLTRDAANQDPDFELDLEQELMGEFGSVEASEQAASASTGDREDIDLSSLSADFDEAFSGMLAETEAPSGAPVEDETGSAKEADDAQDANLAGVDEVFEGLDLTLDDEFLAEAPQVASDASIAVDTLPSDDLHPGEAATVSAPVSDCEVAQIAADSSDPATDVEHSAASSAGEAVAAPVVSAPSSLEDELRALLGRVNAPGMRAPEPANDGGRSEMRVAASVPAGSGAAISDRAPVGVPEIHVEADDDVSGLYVGDGDVSPEEEGTAPLDGLPSFEDFSFDENDFESAELASALEETLAGDEQLHAAAEAEYARHIDREAAVTHVSDEAEEADDNHVDLAMDLEAELASFAQEPDATASPAAAHAAPTALRPLTFGDEKPASTAAPEPAPAFDWRKRFSEMKSAAEAPPAPAAVQPKQPDADPFAALAALASQSPTTRGYSRGNPVAIPGEQPSAALSRSSVERPAVVSPALASWRAQAESAAAARSATRAPVTHRDVSEEIATPSIARGEPERPVQRDPMASPQRLDTPPLTLRSTLPPAASATRAAAPAPAAFSSFSSAPAKPAPSAAAPDDEFDLAALLDSTDLAPEVETVDVAEGVSLADELDIPDVPRHEPAVPSSAYDDLEADFADAFQQLSLAPQPKAAAPAPRSSVEQGAEDDYYVADTPVSAGHTYTQPEQFDLGQTRSQAYEDDADRFDLPADQHFDPVEDEYDQRVYAGQPVERRQPSRRALVLAAAVAGVAIVGGVGAYALSGGSSTGGAPALVKADPTPIKVKPETPGGVVVPNQDGQVYEQVRGQPVEAPSQETLVTAAEEPLPTAVVPARPAPEGAAPVAEAELPGVESPQLKSEMRITPEETAETSAPAEVLGVAPRKVRTMIVRPDGTLVPREDPPAPSPVTTAQGIPAGADPATLAVVQPSQQIPSAVQGAADDVSILPPENAEESASALDTPSASVVIVPLPRPSRSTAAAASEPVREVAAAPAPVVRSQPAPAPVAEPVSAPATVASGGSLWTVQIASQPTREGAQATYEDMATRYGGVLGGKGVNIIQAEVSGKGTMWRVRVPAASKNDANILCAKLKTAGGTCFVTQ